MHAWLASLLAVLVVGCTAEDEDTPAFKKGAAVDTSLDSSTVVATDSASIAAVGRRDAEEYMRKWDTTMCSVVYLDGTYGYVSFPISVPGAWDSARGEPEYDRYQISAESGHQLIWLCGSYPTRMLDRESIDWIYGIELEPLGDSHFTIEYQTKSSTLYRHRRISTVRNDRIHDVVRYVMLDGHEFAISEMMYETAVDWKPGDRTARIVENYRLREDGKRENWRQTTVAPYDSVNGVIANGTMQIVDAEARPCCDTTTVYRVGGQAHTLTLRNARYIFLNGKWYTGDERRLTEVK